MWSRLFFWVWFSAKNVEDGWLLVRLTDELIDIVVHMKYLTRTNCHPRSQNGRKFPNQSRPNKKTSVVVAARSVRSYIVRV